jgi:phenylalanyl-tRNA synthetase alpha chain
MSAMPDEVKEQLEKARSEGRRLISKAADLGALEQARVQVLGRKASLSQARSSLGALPLSDRKAVGRLANEVQAELELALASKAEAFEAEERRRRWETERIDVTLPGDVAPMGAVHPLTRTIWNVVDIFIGLGYRMVEGPEVELGRYLFDALNMPAHHPARSPLDTFFIKGGDGEVVLRSETSAVQIRTMESQHPPVYVVIPGRTYRREAEDATHTAGFSQIECLAVDEGITMADLKGTLQLFARRLFGEELDVRFRPSFFPFTEPSAEMDVQCFVCRGRGCRVCKNEGWIELLGSGMVDPFLLQWVGYDAERYTGFAFGVGVERIAALAHGVVGIRAFYDNDLRFLSQFKGMA